MVAGTCNPTTQEAEAGELLELWRWRLQWAEFVPLHSSLGNRAKAPSKKKNKNKTKNLFIWNCYPNFVDLEMDLEAGGSRGQEIEAILANTVKLCLY